MTSLLLFLSVILAIAHLNSIFVGAASFGNIDPIPDADVLGSIKDAGTGAKVVWSIDKDTITFWGEAPTSGWFAIGISDVNSMTDVDVYMSFVTGGTTFEIQDQWAASKAQPTVDASQDITKIGGSDAGGKMTFKFSRALDTKDGSQDLKISDKSQYVLLATSTSQALGTQHNKKNLISTNLIKGTVSGPSLSNFAVHGIIMTLAWFAIPSIAILIARFLKDHMGHRWFILHRGLMTFVVVLGLAGVIFLLSTENFYTSLHAIIGFCLTAASVINAFMGLAADKMWSPDRTKIPVFPDITHAWVGKLLLLVAWVQLFLGYLNHGSIAGAVVAAIFAVIAIVLLIYLDRRFGVVHHVGGNGAEKALDITVGPRIMKFLQLLIAIGTLFVALGVIFLSVGV